ncbi:MAG: NYN domain-containing protein [Gammaproteobacteria bacterium]|nr:NYN domain-containing protein [Gammaproteobacteria bacterium]
MKRVAIFVDVQNIYYTTKQAFGRSFDYRKLWEDVSFLGEIVHANAYAIESKHIGQQNFQSALRAIGFKVKLKPFIQRSDGSAKGDWDVGITLDVIDIAPSVDIVVLLSGDGDFAMLIEKVKNDYGAASHVYGVKSLTAKALMDAADRFTPIDTQLLLR